MREEQAHVKYLGRWMLSKEGNDPCGTEPQINARSRPVMEAQTGKISGQRCFRLSCSQECCSSTSTEAQRLFQTRSDVITQNRHETLPTKQLPATEETG